MQASGRPLLLQEVDERHQVRAAQPNHPAGHGGAAQGDAEARKLRLLAVKRQAVDELGGDDVRKQRGRCQAYPAADSL